MDPLVYLTILLVIVALIYATWHIREGFEYSITPKNPPPIPQAGAKYLASGGNNHVIVIYNKDNEINTSRNGNVQARARYKYDNIKNNKYKKPIMIIYRDESSNTRPTFKSYPQALKYWNGGVAQYNGGFVSDYFYTWVET